VVGGGRGSAPGRQAGSPSGAVPGTAAPANSPPTNTVLPASARARTRPAFPGSTVEMLVPQVRSAALAKDAGRPGGPSHTEGVVVVVVGSSTGTDSAPRPAGIGPAGTGARR